MKFECWNLKCIAESGLHPYRLRLPHPRALVYPLLPCTADVAPQPVWGSAGSIASPGMAGAPRSVPLYPVAKVRTRSKGEAYRVAKNSKARRASDDRSESYGRKPEPCDRGLRFGNQALVTYALIQHGYCFRSIVQT